MPETIKKDGSIYIPDVPKLAFQLLSCSPEEVNLAFRNRDTNILEYVGHFNRIHMGRIQSRLEPLHNKGHYWVERWVSSPNESPNAHESDYALIIAHLSVSPDIVDPKIRAQIREKALQGLEERL